MNRNEYCREAIKNCIQSADKFELFGIREYVRGARSGRTVDGVAGGAVGQQAEALGAGARERAGRVAARLRARPPVRALVRVCNHMPPRAIAHMHSTTSDDQISRRNDPLSHDTLRRANYGAGDKFISVR
jgi:hypothetical protein